jgi:DNA topoisomerase I
MSASNLVIVESPAKAKTIERYLGPDYRVLASYGHIRDLPRSNFAIEDHGDGDCSLVYEVPERAQKHVAALRKAARTADTVWLAPDLDREGEAIAWHLTQVLDLDVATTNRVTFDEITEGAIRAAFADPRHLDMALVEAQQARRAVDRIVGYRLSPVLWRTVASGISAGRVQSVALRILVDREDEIRAFVPETYFDLAGAFGRTAGAADIRARLVRADGLRLATPKDLEGKDARQQAELRVVRTQAEADALVARAEALGYAVTEVRRTQQQRNPKPPFKTSTLQGEASRIGFSARQAMAVAQQLYEGISLGGEQVGLITYMRTDSLNLSEQALKEIGGFVRSEYGERYTLDKPRRSTTSTKGAQEAHEAIRPTSVLRTPDAVRRHLTSEQARLYELIWSRTVATQMAPAVFDRVAADVTGSDADGELVFRVTGQVERFDGFLRAYRMERDEDEASEDEEGDGLPDLVEGEALLLDACTAEAHETAPPPRFSERTLVEALEELGIGRPSTYASIISTLEQRQYVTKESRRFFPTPLGEVVVAFLKRHFAEIVDVHFTARMEETLDEIAAGGTRWCGTVLSFLDEVDTWVGERKPERPRLPLRIPTPCPECEAPMERVFSGRARDWFASCSRWPDCDGTLPLEPDGTVGQRLEVEPDEAVPCPLCTKPMQLRDGRYGRFYSCVDYPSCRGIRNLQNRAVHMTADGTIAPFRSVTDPTRFMELRTSRYGKPFLGSTGYPDDVFSVWSLPLATPCPECGAPLRPPPRNRKLPTAVCANPTVNHVFELDSFDVPSVATQTVVDGIPAYDPELGGTPLAMDDVPGPITMTYVGSQEPPAPRARPAREAGGASGGAGSSTAKKATAKRATRKKTPSKVTARTTPAKKVPAKKAPAKKSIGKKASKKAASSKKDVGRKVGPASRAAGTTSRSGAGATVGRVPRRSAAERDAAARESRGQAPPF